MPKFFSWNQMLDFGQAADGPVCVLRLAEPGYVLAFELTPGRCTSVGVGVGHTCLGVWKEN